MDTEGIRVRGTSSSLYEQVRSDLLERILSGEFKPGDLLPTEEALCREYGVSRITVRRAVADLAANFFVTRKRGVGTIVTRRLSDRRVFRLSGFFEETTRFDQTEFLNVVEPASTEVAEALQIEPGTPVRHRLLVSARNGEAFTMIDRYTIERNGAPGEGGRGDASRLGPRIERAEQELAATKANALVAKHLGIRPGRPILIASRVYLSSDDRPVRYTISRYHPDRYRFTVDLRPARDNIIFEPSGSTSRRKA
ncbi:GntR family transcriptional regulator [Faunimonas sp. B44]|uniref:GntR family transcriptional regulator n=1 Tax=Faunimonas sp. B44 TaxID=3461493 RepID=UPI004044DBF1